MWALHGFVTVDLKSSLRTHGIIESDLFDKISRLRKNMRRFIR